jgi:ketosteroid isomerase-like protein
MTVIRQFTDALTALERDGDVDAIVSLFSDRCDIGNAVSPKVFVGHDGAREFWTAYRSWFGRIHSSIHNVIDSGGRSAIEWSSTGTSATGHFVSYEGVSILDFDGGRISRFRAYFNPDALSRQMRLARMNNPGPFWPY